MSDPFWYPADGTAGVGSVIHETAVYEGSGDEPPLDGGSGPGADSAQQHAPDAADSPQDGGFTAYSTGQAALRGGEIVVTATEFGLPLNLHVDSGQLRRDPADLADDLLRLCRLAANRAGSARRTELTHLGLPDNALDLLGLPTQDTVERTELGDEDSREYEPRSWLDHDGSAW